MSRLTHIHYVAIGAITVGCVVNLVQLYQGFTNPVLPEATLVLDVPVQAEPNFYPDFSAMPTDIEVAPLADDTVAMVQPEEASGDELGEAEVEAITDAPTDSGLGTMAMADTEPIEEPSAPPVEAAPSVAPPMAEPTMASMVPSLERRPGLDATSIRNVVKSHMSEISTCYQRALKTQADLRGRLLVNWDVSPDGRVVSVVVAPAGPGSNHDLAACVDSAVQHWEFPQGGSTVQVSYPFMLNSTG